ncbi:MAG: helix-turn-helix domain-containing protein [Eubacteriales bacterium]|nr:helix-turn-helix domain-containing protein [Eubacteriales bacterium]
MKLLLGNKIKALRKACGITQEQLADAIGISFQAVSKWENNIALPDITLAPSLASYFGVTMDELFEFNLKEMNEKVESICTEAYRYRESNPEKSRNILEEGLKQYPDNDVLLNNLLYVMNYTKNPDETITLANRLIEKTTENDIKYDALRFLAYAYNAKGDTASAVAAMEQIPELYFTKLSEMAFILTGEAKYKAAEKQKWISFEILLQMMWKIAECYEADGKTNEAISETMRALALVEALHEEPKIERFQSHIKYFKNQIERMKNK